MVPTEESPQALPREVAARNVFGPLGALAPEVLYEDNHLLCLFKPAGLLSQSADDPHLPDLLSVAREYVALRYAKPGRVYLGLVHRLDRATMGPMVMARTSKAAARLSKQFRERETSKQYHALVAGRVEPAAGTCEDWMRKDERQRRAYPAREGERGAQLARLRYRSLLWAEVKKRQLNEALFPEPGDQSSSRGARETPAQGQGATQTRGTDAGGADAEVAGPKQHAVSLLEVELLTGRFHQIRFQLANLGHPILGDTKYHSRFFLRNHALALECTRLEFEHPTTRETIALPGRAHLASVFATLSARPRRLP